MALPIRKETLTFANARAISARGPDFVVETARALGANFRLSLGPSTLTIVSDPAELQYLLQKRTAAWGRGTSVDGIRPLLGNGLPLSDPPLWLSQRRTMQPAFHKGHGPRWVELMAEVAGPQLAALKTDVTVSTRHLMMTIARDIIVRAMFSGSLGSDVSRVDAALGTVEDFVGTLAMTPVHLPLWMPTPLHRRFRAASAYLSSRLLKLIEERRTMSDPPRDLLTMLVQARDPEGGAAMSDQQLRDEVMNIFFAGHETTANVLTWAVLLLHQNPEARRKAADEVDTVLQGRSPVAEDIPNLGWLGSVVRETLRLYPPAWMFGRQALEPDTISGVPMKKGQLALMVPYVTHRLAEHWPDPDRFDPSRFTTERSVDAAVWKYRYLPFGAGPHVCIGNHFAMLELVTVLALLLQRGHLEVLDPAAARPKIGATLSIQGGLPVRFVPRA